MAQTVLIIDGSGSMWGRIGKREKISIARNVLAQRIMSLKGRTELGVMSYGHRRRRDCRDIEMIVPISPLIKKRQARAIRRLLPRGKTPISSAIRAAARALAEKSKGRTGVKQRIILIADGAENCRLDPCQTARDIASGAPALAIDVIAFGVGRKLQDEAGLSCIARATGGKYLRADNRKELERAVETAFAGIGAEGNAPSTASDKGETPSRLAEKPGLYLKAGLANDGKALDEGVSWRIYKIRKDGAKGSAPLTRLVMPNPVIELEPGEYLVEARYGPLLARRKIHMGKGRAIHEFLSFNAGIISVAARLGENSPLLEDAIFTLYEGAGKGGSGKKEKTRNIISYRQEKKAVFRLPAGDYSLRASSGHSERLFDFKLEAGQLIEKNLILNGGHVRPAAALADGSPPLDNVQFAIFRLGERNDSEFLRTLDPKPVLTLPAGQYVIEARAGEAARNRRVKIGAGDDIELPILLNAGILRLSSSLDGGDDKSAERTNFTIKSLSASPPVNMKLIDGHLRETPTPLPERSFRRVFILPAGKYEITALAGDSNARARARVEIAPGKESKLRISLKAGRLSLALLLARGDEPLPGVFWSIFDKSGAQVASASGTNPVLTLASGEYRIMAEYLDKSMERRISLGDGESRKLEFILQ
jgi:Ca-activated chloride channel family protein